MLSTGAKVVLLALPDGTLPKVVEGIKVTGGNASCYEVDCTDSAAVAKVCATIEKVEEEKKNQKRGKCKCVANNAHLLFSRVTIDFKGIHKSKAQISNFDQKNLFKFFNFIMYIHNIYDSFKKRDSLSKVHRAGEWEVFGIT